MSSPELEKALTPPTLGHPIPIRFSKDFLELLDRVARLRYMQKTPFIREHCERAATPILRKLLASELRRLRSK